MSLERSGLMAMILVVTALWACHREAEAPVESEAVAVLPAEAPLSRVEIEPVVLERGQIQVVEAESSSVPLMLDVTGRIELNEGRTVRVGSVVDGRVTRVHTNIGDTVREGETLAELHSHEVHEARSDYAKAVAELDRCNAELEFYENARARATRLYELKAGSLEQLQRAEADLKTAHTRAKVAQAEIGRVVERLHHMGVDATGAYEEYTESATPGSFEREESVPVVSPLTGVVLQRMVTPGTVVTPADDLFVISDLNTLWVQAEVPEANLAALKEGQTVEIRVRAYGEESFQARLDYVGDVLNPETRTVQVRCVLENPERRLRPEMYATIRFELGTHSNVVTVPETALQTVDGRSVVFLRVGEAAFEPRIVETGSRFGSLVEIKSGLAAGEVIAGSGSFLLKSELLKFQMSEE